MERRIDIKKMRSLYEAELGMWAQSFIVGFDNSPCD